MKKIVLGAAVAAAAIIATPATAQTAQTWTGPHVGAYVGLNALNTDVQDYWCDIACDAPTLKDNDLAAGLAIGYDFQVDNNFVVGIEGDIGLGTDQGSVTQDTDPTYGEDYRFDVKLKRFATLRARAGLAIDNTMVYATGGLATSKVRYSAASIYTGSYSMPNWTDYGAGDSQRMTGYVLGGGIEHSFGAFSLKAEMLHADLGSSDRACFADLEGTDAGECWDEPAEDYLVVSPVVNSVRLGFNFRF